MSNSQFFTMASNIPANAEESLTVPRLDMSRVSVQDLLDGDDRNSMEVDRNLPRVPLNNTNPLQSVTIGDITNRGGPLSGLRLTDADIIIEDLNKQLVDAVAKSDSSTALLQRMDAHQKSVEAELARLKVESKQLKEEKESAEREKRDYTVNQEKLRDKIRSELEKEFAEKEQNLLAQLKSDMRSKIETKVASIRTQYQQEYKEELSKLKSEWSQERKRVSEQHQIQIAQVLKDVEMLKQQQSTIQQPIEPGDKLSGLKSEAFNFVPGTINTKRGAAVNLQDNTIIWNKSEVEAPPVPARKSVHFTSTPRPPSCKNLFDSDEEPKTEPLSNTNPFVGHISEINRNPIICQDNPFLDIYQQNNPGHMAVESEATTFINNTMAAVATEFKKMREPKLPKLKGGTTSGATFFLNTWIKDVKAVIKERSLSDSEVLQLVKDYTEGRACQQVEFYMASTPVPTFDGLIQNLVISFQSGEDEATVKYNFYAHKQSNKESVDDFADILQVLARKVLNADLSFVTIMNKSLCQQLSNELKDNNHSISARSILTQHLEIEFAEFRSQLANVLGCQVRQIGGKGALCSTVSASGSPDSPEPKHRKTEDETAIATQLALCIQGNKELHKRLDDFDPNKIVEVVSQAVSGSYQKSFKSNPFTKPANSSYQSKPQSGPPPIPPRNQFGNPYLGVQQEPQVTPGADGSLNPALSCKYCKDTSHDVSNYAKVKRKEALKAASASQNTSNKPKGN